MSIRTGPDGYDDALGRTKPAKGERAALVRYLEQDETVQLRAPAVDIGEADGRDLMHGGALVVVTDRKFVAARTTGGFRPSWEVFTLPYGHLEPGVEVRGEAGIEVFVPTSGRRSYRVVLPDPGAAAALVASLGAALHAYRRDRMDLADG